MQQLCGSVRLQRLRVNSTRRGPKQLGGHGQFRLASGLSCLVYSGLDLLSSSGLASWFDEVMQC